MNRIPGIVALAGALTLPAAPIVPLAAIPFGARASDETLATFDSCWRHVRQLPRATSRDDIPWSDLKREFRPRADAADPGVELQDVLNEMLGQLGISHTAVLDQATYDGMMRELSGKPTPTFGLLLEEMEPGRLFVRAMYEQGPAERAGLLLGDEIVAVDGDVALQSRNTVDAGYDPRPAATRLFALRPSGRQRELELLVRSEPRARLRRVTLEQQETSGLESGRRSMRVVERDGRRIGIVHLWMVARGSGDLMQEAVRRFSTCDALIVDLRGRGGLSNEIDGILAPFRAAHGRRVGRNVRPWTKPVFFLTDDRTRSAKELLAWHIRNESLGPVIGERTEGAVLGAHFVPLPGGHWLELGMVEVPVGGVSLEGVGVEPTDPVRHLGPFAQGVDPILERAVDVAALSPRSFRRPI